MMLRSSKGPLWPEAAAPAAAGRKGESLTKASSGSVCAEGAVAGAGTAVGAGAADVDTAATAGNRPATRVRRYRKAIMAINFPAPVPNCELILRSSRPWRGNKGGFLT